MATRNATKAQLARIKTLAAADGAVEVMREALLNSRYASIKPERGPGPNLHEGLLSRLYIKPLEVLTMDEASELIDELEQL